MRGQMTEHGLGAVPAALRAALEDQAGTEPLLVALDFDGVLAPSCRGPRTPGRCRPRPPPSPPWLTCPDDDRARLRPGAGQPPRRSPPPDRPTLLIGSHGAEIFTGPDGRPLVLDQPRGGRWQRPPPSSKSGGRPPGHGAGSQAGRRRTPYPDRGRRCGCGSHRAGQGRLQEIPGLQLSDGKRVLETSVLSADKGQGIGLLRSFSGATAVFFAGDDVTDEHAFAVLRDADVGVKVGPGTTAAQYRVESPQAFAAALALLAELRAAAVQV